MPMLPSPGDHAFAAHHREARHDTVGIVVSTDAQDVVQAAEPHVAPDESPQTPVGHDEVPVEVGPEGLASPAFRLAEPTVSFDRTASRVAALVVTPETWSRIGGQSLVSAPVSLRCQSALVNCPTRSRSVAGAPGVNPIVRYEECPAERAW